MNDQWPPFRCDSSRKRFSEREKRKRDGELQCIGKATVLRKLCMQGVNSSANKNIDRPCKSAERRNSQSKDS